MDRVLSPQQLNKQKAKTYLIGALAVAGMALGFIKFKSFVKPSVDAGALTIAVAEVGSLEASVAASGTIIPEYEVLITSPVDAKIEKVLHTAGERVNAGESLLQLNKESSLIAYEKLTEEQQVNRNKINQLELSLQKSLNELKTQYSIKEIRIKSLETAVAHEQSLLSIGGGTEENLKQARLNLKIAQLELKQLQNQIVNQKAMMQADLRSLGYEINIRDKDINEISDKLRKAAITSPRNGVITWINDKIGSELREGDELVRIADLSSYKVEAGISDNYADEVKVGNVAIVRINNADLRGKITHVQPTIENGIVEFAISLDQKNAPQLRPNLKADVFVVTSFKTKTTRVQNGAAFNGSEEQTVFVMRGKTAVARKVKIGESNSEYVEIRSGIKPGEKVITSDMQEYMHLNNLEVK
ncbi:efflux RND transporter periplasmic adaptor subunit [Pedobacter sp. SYSU D00535]|uniref:efflux RND transporter periplasmic adaptor subunit n=1 Tax=Pedobacter sp. SYSU D00535 TaxID=2810308 RepID=UPI001A9651E5|nr:HlyD family efflux transporter periplasmic adaptor subunit [Pedobacter sp. SYSU D00535]